MYLESRLDALHFIYQIYDKYIKNVDTVCDRLCSHCCTTNVTMTSLEGAKIIDYMTSTNPVSFFAKLEDAKSLERFEPQMTINGFAQMCASDVDEDAIDAPDADKTTTCPLLKDRECTIYPVRPFGCRCFVSKHNCSEKGFADIDPFTLTVNNLFLQYIEHSDEKGVSGNLIDILLFLKDESHYQLYRKQQVQDAAKNLIPNQKIPLLMVPPEHRKRLEPIMAQLNEIRISNINAGK